MCIVKAALVVFGLFAALIEASEKSAAFQEMVKANLLASPKLDKMLENPAKMRETLEKIGAQDGTPGFEDVDKLINDLQDEARSRSAKISEEKDGQPSATTSKTTVKTGDKEKKEKKEKKKNKEEEEEVEEEEEEEEEQDKKALDFNGIPGMENLQDILRNPEKMKEVMNTPAVRNLQEMMTNPDKMKEVMNTPMMQNLAGMMKNPDKMRDAMAKIKKNGQLDKLKGQLGGLADGFDVDSVMDKLNEVAPGMEDMMSKLLGGNPDGGRAGEEL